MHRIPLLPSPAPRSASSTVLAGRPLVVPGRGAVRRAPDAVQFGVEDPLVLDGLTPPLARMVAGLDGTRRGEAVLADAVAAGASPARVRAVMAVLLDAGLVAGEPPGAAPGPGVVVHGGGRVAVALAVLLAGSGACRVALAAGGVVTPDDVGTGLTAADVGRPRAAAAADVLARAGATGPPDPRPELAVLAGGAVPDARAVTAVAGAAHLPVLVRDGRGVVGPLVLPGRTACLRCDELTRRDADPGWPAVAAALRDRPAPADLVVAGATAALAAGQVLEVLRGEAAAPGVLGGVLELDPRGGTLRRRPRPPHPGCGCRDARRPVVAAA